jgi:Ca2+-transporting ATPase
MTYILAIHVPIAGLALLPLLLGLPPLMLPVHVVVTEMIIDPVCSLAFENAPQARGLMERPPRAANALLVDRALVMRALAQGAGLLAVALAAYALALGAGMPANEARTLAFVGLTAGNLAMVAVNAGAGLPLRDLWGPQFRSFQIVAASPPAGALAGVLAAVGAVMVLAWRLQPQRS